MIETAAPSVPDETGGSEGLALEDCLPQTRAALLETRRVFTAEALERALHRLADAGWNAVVLPGFLDGYPIFPSPVWAEYGMRRQHPGFKKWNPFETAFEVAWRRGLDILVAYAPYVAGPSEGRRKPTLLRRHPKWAAARHPKRKRRAPAQGDATHYCCPVSPDYRRFICDTLHVMVEDYPCHGLLIDLREYPFYTGRGDEVPYCYCDACREATVADLGFDPASVDLTRERKMVERWREWQTAQMDAALAHIRLRALKARGTMRILGLLTTDSGLDEERGRPLIHWKTWVEGGMVEGLMLDRYSPDPEIFETQLAADLGMLPQSSLLFPLLPRKVGDGQRFLDLFAKYPIPGFATRYEDWDQPDFAPEARVSFSTPAFPVDSDPIQSICVLFAKMARLVPGEEEFAKFLGDLGRVLLRQDVLLDVERLLMIADNIRGLYNRVRDGHLHFGRNQDEMLHNLDLAWRLAYLAGCDLRE